MSDENISLYSSDESTDSSGDTTTTLDNMITVNLTTIMRTSSSSSSSPVNVVRPGELLTKLNETKTYDNGEMYEKVRTSTGTSGWILSANSPDSSNTTPASAVSTTTTNSPPETSAGEGVTPATTVYDENEDLEGSGYLPEDSWIDDFEGKSIDNDAFNSIGSILGTFGLPYQFLPDTDMRLDGTDNIQSIGSVYASKIIAAIPLFFISPGRANFMTAYGKSQSDSILSVLVQGKKETSSEGMSDILQGKNGRYYTFDHKLEEYYTYCNPACRLAAILYGVGDKTLPGDGPESGKKLMNVNWMNVTKGPMKIWGYDSSYSSIPFYIDADNSISESFSNTTAQSSLANTINSISDMGRELGFLLGYGSAALSLDDDGIREAVNQVNGSISKILSGSNFLKNLTTHLGTVATGGKLMFPQIWNESSFSKSYDIKLKFVSPNCNKLSIFLNIIVPLIHLVCLVAPQSADDNPNGYHSPFLVRGIYKGLFNIDMGIITSMNVNKGSGGMFTPDGVPTSVEVDMTIKDLYDVALTVTPGVLQGGSFNYNTTTNTLLMDYLSNLVGVNMYAPEVSRQLKMYESMIGNSISDSFNSIYSKAQRSIANMITNLFGFRSY